MKLIASNLSNVDTPGYKAQDLDFDAAMRAAQGQRDGSQMQVTDSRHIAVGGSGNGLNPLQITREVPLAQLPGRRGSPQHRQGTCVGNLDHGPLSAPPSRRLTA